MGPGGGGDIVVTDAAHTSKIQDGNRSQGDLGCSESEREDRMEVEDGSKMSSSRTRVATTRITQRPGTVACGAACMLC